MKRCPDCAEMIQDQARVCRFCRAEITSKDRSESVRHIGGYPARAYIPGCVIISVILLLGMIGTFTRPQVQDEKSSPPQVSLSPAVRPTTRQAEPDRFKVQFMAERKLKETLKDADSAKFRSVRVPSGAAYACGEVNSRNGFGGMTGYRRFIAGAASSMPVALEGENMDENEFGAAWQKLC